MRQPAYHDAAAIAAAVSPRAAVDALEAALRDGLDPAKDPARSSVPAGAGELLVMPATAAGVAGVKLVTVGGDPRVQGVYVLFDADTLAPVAVLDGIAMTGLRTAAVSALAVRHLAAPDASRLLVFGTGAQGWAHVEAIRAERPIARVDVVGRDQVRLATFVARCRAAGLEATAASAAAATDADVICCATTARAPLFDGARLRAGATVVAVGSHEPDARELDDATMARARMVVVEERDAALREAGDVVQAIGAGILDPAALVTLDALVRGEASAVDAGRTDAPTVFKSIGMAWEDLVVASAVHASAPLRSR